MAAALGSPRRIRDHVGDDPAPRADPVRLRVFAGVIVLAFALLIARLWFLQILRGDHFRDEARANASRPVLTVAPRGAIVDASGGTLVTNQAQFTVSVVPSDLPRPEAARAAVVSALAQALEVPVVAVAAALAPRGRTLRGDNPVPVAENVSRRTLARIAENRLRLPGVVAEYQPVRSYPRGDLASHLLGYIGQVTEGELSEPANQRLGYGMGDFIGKSGLESEYDRLLCGTKGETWYVVDARGSRKRALRHVAPRAGATLKLSVRADVQAAAQRALAGRWGAAVALDPRNGRVLALASNPGYDPNVFSRRPLRPAVYQSLTDKRDGYRLLNRAVSSPQPPGSTFKVITAVAGLASGAITERTGDHCAGHITIGRRARKRCHSVHRAVNLESALAASCDVFFYHAGFRIGPTPLAQWAGRFGLGHKTGIDLPSEKVGTVPSPAWKAVMAPKFGNPDTGWYPGDTANVAIGQGDLQTTPLQMAQVAAAVANGGVIYRPRVVEQATSPDGRTVLRTRPEVLHKIRASGAHLGLVAEGMRAVVAGARGTSRRAALPGITVAGKSGSAETRGGGPTHAWFIAYAPYEKPTIAVCVFLESNGQSLHGGSDAAPVARTMMAAYFGVAAGPKASGSGGASSTD